MQHGVDQTLDVLRAFATLAAKIKEVTADGMDITDLLAIIADPAVREALENAVRGAGEIPDELGDLTVAETRQLVDAAFDIIEAIRG